MRDMQALSDVVTLAIKAAMAPVLERLAAAEARLTRMTEAEQALGVLRDRVTTVETKSAMPVQISEAVPVDLTPALERLSAAEARLARVPVVELALGELRDKLIALETKASIPVTIHEPELLDLGPLEKRVTDLEDAPVLDEIVIDHRERIANLEKRSFDPVVHEKELSVLRERLAVLETRAPIPGPPGPAGRDGLDGKDGATGLNGKDGADGFAFEDLAVTQKDDRSFTVKAIKGSREKDIGTARFQMQIQRGVYLEGKTYEPGDVVTWGGSQWHCNDVTTMKPGDGSKAWTLIVKRGRDGKDGRDAVQTPVVSIVGAK